MLLSIKQKNIKMYLTAFHCSASQYILTTLSSTLTAFDIFKEAVRAYYRLLSWKVKMCYIGVD